MAKMTDGKKYVDLYMGYWMNDHYTIDFSDDFFEVGSIPSDEEGFHLVDDLDYCVEMMEDWCNGLGDYYGDEDNDPNFDSRVIGINTIKEVK